MKTVELHQINIEIIVKILEDKKSHGLHKFNTGLLLDTDEEWADTREKIQSEIERIQKQFDQED